MQCKGFDFREHRFGTYYRVIQQNFIDMEKMLDLFEEHQAVQDAPDAKDLLIKEGGSVVFGGLCSTGLARCQVADFSVRRRRLLCI